MTNSGEIVDVVVKALEPYDIPTAREPAEAVVAALGLELVGWRTPSGSSSMYPSRPNDGLDWRPVYRLTAAEFGSNDPSDA